MDALTQTNGAALQYRCRRCLATFTPLHVPGLAEAAVALIADGRTPEAWGIIGMMHRTHECNDGGVGIADLIGMIPDKYIDPTLVITLPTDRVVSI